MITFHFQNVSSSLVLYCWCAQSRYAHCCLEIRNFSLLLRRVHRYGRLSTYKRLVVTYLPLPLKDLASLGRSRNELTWKIGLLKGLPITIFGMSIVMCLPTVNRKISTPSFWSSLAREVVCFVSFKATLSVIINKIRWTGFVAFLAGECIFDLT